MEKARFKDQPSYAKRNYLLLVFLQLCRFFGDSFFYGFQYRYIKSLGFDGLKLGVLTALIPFMAVIGNIVISLFANTHKKRRIFIIVYSLTEPTAVLCFGLNRAFWYVMIFDIICNFMSNPFYSLLDTYTMIITGDVKKNYSSARVFGTVAYIFGILIGGYLISYIDYQYTFLIGALFMYLTFVFFMLLKFPKEENELIAQNERKSEDDKKSDYKELFTRDYILFMLGVVLILGSVWAGDNFYQQMTASYTAQEYAYSFDGALIAEVIGHLLCSRARNLKDFRRLIRLSALTLIIRCVVFAVPGMNKYVYLSLECLRGFTFSLCYGSVLFLLARILPFRLNSRGYFIMMALDQLVAAIVNLFGPSIVSAAGGNYMIPFLILAVFGLAAIILISFTKFSEKPLENKDDDLKRE